MVQFTAKWHRTIWYVPDGGLTQFVNTGMRVSVHDDGASYVGTVKEIIVDTSTAVWLQCSFDKIETDTGVVAQPVDKRVWLSFLWFACSYC